MGLTRVGTLCANARIDPNLPLLLERGGLPAGKWRDLLAAIVDGTDEETLKVLLDEVEDAAAASGIDGVTTGSRRFRPLPGAGSGNRTVLGWHCPHPDPCGRVEVGERRVDAPVCGLTADRLTPMRVISR